MTTASLAKLALPLTPLRTVDEFRRQLVALQDVANLVTPVISADYIPDMHAVSLRVVILDSTVIEKGDGNFKTYQGRDVYRDPKFCSADERCLNKPAIMKLLDAAGATLVWSRRVDDGKSARSVTWEVAIEMLQLDGKRIRRIATKTVDLGQDKTSSWTPARLAKAMEHQESNAETKALLRAGRSALSLQQKYSVADLAKPFVVPTLVPMLDTSDPEIRRMVAMKALSLDNTLYGERPTSRVIDVDPATVRVTETEMTDHEDELTPTSTPPSSAADFEPPPQPAQAPRAANQNDCGCPCGCLADLPPDQSEASVKAVGSVRCRECFPGRAFSFERHRNLAKLELKGLPDYTPEDARKRAEQLQAGAGR